MSRSDCFLDLVYVVIQLAGARCTQRSWTVYLQTGTGEIQLIYRQRNKLHPKNEKILVQYEKSFNLIYQMNDKSMNG